MREQQWVNYIMHSPIISRNDKMQLIRLLQRWWCLLTKWFISIKPSICVHLTTIYSRCWTNCLVYVFPTPEEPSAQIYGRRGDPQAGNTRSLCEARAVARWAALHPWRPGHSCQVSSRALPKAQGASRMLFRTPSTRIPHIELIFFWTYIQLFFSCVIKPWGNKENTKKGRKTTVESARRKGRAGGTCKWLPLAGK